MSTTASTPRERVRVSREVIGHAHNIQWANSDMDGAEEAAERLPVREGVHYEVLMTTYWGDYPQPTGVEWADGTFDSFADLEESLANRSTAITVVMDQ